MNYKITNYFLRQYRSGARIQIWHESDEFIWVTDGYIAFRIPACKFELNPALFKKCDLSKAAPDMEKALQLKSTGYIETRLGRVMVPFTCDRFTSWFQKQYIDLIETPFELHQEGPLGPAAIMIRGEYSGIALPIRHEDQIPLF